MDKCKLPLTKSLSLGLPDMQMSFGKRGFAHMKKTQKAGLFALILACMCFAAGCAWEAKASRPVPLKLALEIVEGTYGTRRRSRCWILGSERRDKAL